MGGDFNDRRAAVRVLLVMLLCCVGLTECEAAELEHCVLLEHASDLFRGRPWNDQEEISQDFLAYCATITAGRRRAWEIDLAHGVARIEGEVQNGTKLAVRFYPGRIRRSLR